MNRRPMHLLGRLLITGFGLGYLRPAPGTWGSLPPVVMTLMIVIGLSDRAGDTFNILIVNAALVVLALIFSLACVQFGAVAESHFGKKDPGSVVADEVAGQSVALLLLPWQWTSDARSVQANLLLAAMSFIAFRALDILKPPPARKLQALHAGVGILVDDLVVGVYASIIVHVAAVMLARNNVM